MEMPMIMMISPVKHGLLENALFYGGFEGEIIYQ
jgi:hypothetical protein